MNARSVVDRRGAALTVLCLLGGCGGAAALPEPLLRQGPLGSLRDLVLFDRAADLGGPFFLDRFEVTRGDWAQFLAARSASPTGALPRDGDLSLPMAGMDLVMAREFARWRRCRLPRADEWLWACTTGGRYSFPWGNGNDPARANSAELGLGAVLPVGTFESGRRSGPSGGPYDLIGNVAEWTETVPGYWFTYDLGFVSPLRTATARLEQAPALTLWTWPWAGAVQPPVFLVQAAGAMAPREVFGASFLTSLNEPPEPRAPEDRSDTIGMRVATTPLELIVAVAAGADEYGPDDLEQVRRFVVRGGNAAALLPALQQLDADSPARAFFARFLELP